MSKYNIGDKVRIVSKRGFGWNCDGLMDRYCGKVLTIMDVDDFDDGGALYTMFECPDWSWADEDIAELVKPATKTEVKPSAPEFKVGMKVRIKGDASDCTDHLDGKIGTIVNVMNSDCKVTIDNEDGREWYIWKYNMTPIEEVTPAVEKVEEVTNKKTSAHNASIGYDIEIANLISEFIDDVLKVADKYNVDRRETLEAVVETVNYSVKDKFFWDVIVPMIDMFGKSAK